MHIQLSLLPKLFCLSWFSFFFLGMIAGCTTSEEQLSYSSTNRSTTTQVETETEGDPYVIVDCLLPGQIRRLGTIATFVTARRPIKTTGEDCAIRGIGPCMGQA